MNNNRVSWENMILNFNYKINNAFEVSGWVVAPDFIFSFDNHINYQ